MREWPQSWKYEPFKNVTCFLFIYPFILHMGIIGKFINTRKKKQDCIATLSNQSHNSQMSSFRIYSGSGFHTWGKLVRLGLFYISVFFLCSVAQ